MIHYCIKAAIMAGIGAAVGPLDRASVRVHPLRQARPEAHWVAPRQQEPPPPPHPAWTPPPSEGIVAGPPAPGYEVVGDVRTGWDLRRQRTLSHLATFSERHHAVNESWRLVACED
ncbi:hypothetical protein GCM10023225_11690 [Kineococcus glutinatus]|uniref:Uncharacterized protein n=1 Tax=Kineococcus glutinatus TaxID=1070872 RepID=A0ABP9HJ11_9ACTN